MQAHLAALPGWKRDFGKRLDAINARTLPSVQKVVMWNTSFHGTEDQDWFLGSRVFTHRTCWPARSTA